MTTELSTFNFQGSSDVRVIIRDGDPWFVATDVCSVLGFLHPASNLRRLDDDEKGVHSMHTPGGTQEMTVINESGLYSLILTSRKPEAKRFKKWITSEVLPAIRKTGRYEMPATSVETITPDQVAQIARLVGAISTCCHFQDAAKHAIYTSIREPYGLQNIHTLPAVHFATVYGTLHVLLDKAREYLTWRVSSDKQFISQVLRRHQLQLPLQHTLLW